ncbi:hypothetical protein ACSBR1_014314 [Camellia fascicularis]
MESSEIEVLSRNRSDSSEFEFISLRFRFRLGFRSQRFRSISVIHVSKSKSKVISAIQIDRSQRFRSVIHQSDFEFLSRNRNRSSSQRFRSMFKRSISETALERMSVGSSLVTGTLHRQSSREEVGSRGTECSSNPSKLHRNVSAGANMNNLASQSSSANPVPLKRTSSSFDEKLLVQTLYKVLFSISKTNPIVLYLRDIEKLLFRL